MIDDLDPLRLDGFDLPQTDSPDADIVGGNPLDLDTIDALLLVSSHSDRTRDNERRVQVPQQAVPVLDSLSHCNTCETPVGLPIPQVGAPTEFWRCQGCNDIISAGPIAKPLPKGSMVERTEVGELSEQHFAQRSSALLHELLGIASGTQLGDEASTTEGRYSLSLPIVGTSLCKHLIPQSKAFDLICRDVSESGLSFFSKLRVDAPMLMVDFSVAAMPGKQMLTRVVRERQIGSYYEYGCTVPG